MLTVRGDDRLEDVDVSSRSLIEREWSIPDQAQVSINAGQAGVVTPWHDPETDSVWVATSGLLMEVPLDRNRWVQQACDLVGRDLTEDEWERWIPGDDRVP